MCQTPWFTQHRNVEREKNFVVTLSLKQKSPSDISRPKHRYGWHYQILVACYRIIATKWDKATICYKCYFRLTNTRAFEINCLFFWFSFANRDLVYSEGRSRSPVQPASTWQTSGTASETSLPARWRFVTMTAMTTLTTTTTTTTTRCSLPNVDHVWLY